MNASLRRQCRSPTPTSSRPTTSAACTASRSTAMSPSRSGARSFASSPAWPARRRATCASASGATCASTAPELAARYRDGMVAEGAHVLDAGLVGTEMLYFLVGSRELDGGLMCTASHNPKAYTGAKLVERGRDRAEGRPRASRTSARPIEDGLGDAPGGGSVRGGRHLRGRSSEAALTFIDPGNVRPLKVVVDGGNGMAGPMVGPLLERLGLDLVADVLQPDGDVPRSRAQPAARGEPPLHRRQGPRDGRRPGHRVGRRRRPLLLHRRRRDLRRRRLPHRDPRRAPAGQGSRRLRSSTTSAPRARWPTRSSAPAGARFANRVGHAFFKTRMRDEGAIFGGEVSGHYYFHDFYNADSGHDPRAARAREALRRGQDA